ncbi:hypothetical protein EMCRGX_G021048 [Ephydatia muelleri]
MSTKRWSTTGQVRSGPVCRDVSCVLVENACMNIGSIHFVTTSQWNGRWLKQAGVGQHIWGYEKNFKNASPEGSNGEVHGCQHTKQVVA